jgi:hypothetical protein
MKFRNANEEVAWVAFAAASLPHIAAALLRNDSGGTDGIIRCLYAGALADAMLTEYRNRSRT